MADKTETEVIIEQVQRALILCHELFKLAPRESSVLHALNEALGMIDITACRARDKTSKLCVQVGVPEMSEHVVRALLATGFDNALSACVPQLKTVRLDGSMIAWVPPVNPFSHSSAEKRETAEHGGVNCKCPYADVCPVHGSRQERVQAITGRDYTESKTSDRKICKTCKHLTAADGHCALACGCKACYVVGTSLFQGAQQRCAEPGCKLHEAHGCKHTDGETEWPYTCACGYDHGDLGSDGLCVRCGGRVQK